MRRRASENYASTGGGANGLMGGGGGLSRKDSASLVLTRQPSAPVMEALSAASTSEDDALKGNICKFQKKISLLLKRVWLCLEFFEKGSLGLILFYQCFDYFEKS